MRNNLFLLPVIIVSLLWPVSCQQITPNAKKSIVVTYSILGSIVKELVGDQASVTVSMPNGLDPHEWQPSAKDIETINKADLVVENGLGLEGGMQKTLAAAKGSGVKFFTAADHIVVRHVGAGEGIPRLKQEQVRCEIRAVYLPAATAAGFRHVDTVPRRAPCRRHGRTRFPRVH